MTGRPLLVVDGDSFAHRAFHGVPRSVRRADGRPGNAYTLRVENRDRAAHRLRLALEAPAGFELLAGVNPVELGPTASRELRVFVAGPREERDDEPQRIAFALSDVERPALRVQRGATFLFERGEPEEHDGR